MPDTQPPVVVTQEDREAQGIIAQLIVRWGPLWPEKVREYLAQLRLSTQSSMQAEIDRLTANGIHTCHDQCERPLCVLRRERNAAQARIEELEAALRPIARLAETVDKGQWLDQAGFTLMHHHEYVGCVKLCELRAARATLSNIAGEGK